MSEGIAKGDLEFLPHIAEFDYLTVSQIVFLTQRNAKSIRRRLTILENNGLIKRYPRGGQKEHLIALTQAGIQALEKKGVPVGDLKEAPQKIFESQNIQHNLLQNFFHICLLRLEKTFPRFTINFVNTRSKKIVRGNKNEPFYLPHPKITGQEEIPVIPDGVFSIRDQESGKSLLFFLEVDMGTEALGDENSKSYNTNTISGKIIRYQKIFYDRLYKNYEPIFNDQFEGFRLLFLANDTDGLKRLCRVVRQRPNTDFIWLTEKSQLESEGITEKIWVKGGLTDAPLESIFGSLQLKNI